MPRVGSPEVVTSRMTARSKDKYSQFQRQQQRSDARVPQRLKPDKNRGLDHADRWCGRYNRKVVWSDRRRTGGVTSPASDRSYGQSQVIACGSGPAFPCNTPSQHPPLPTTSALLSEESFVHPSYYSGDLPLSTAHNRFRRSQRLGMADSAELEQMQRLSENFSPDLPGPLIGNKVSVSNLVKEYSQADQAFVLKTQSLAAVCDGYRQVKGDGQCGWRGAVFGYFETLLALGDYQLVVREETRLQSFKDLMLMAGIDYEIMVDMFDSTWELFQDLKHVVSQGGNGEQSLMRWLNEENSSNSIVYHFKMMTSAYMQLHPDDYEPFLEMSINEYRIARIDPTNQEIDQIGLQVMTDAVISPAGFALDVFYLDRSVGDEVTPHEFAPKISAAGGPTIRMLYRPGHYDLIYKPENRTFQVYLQNEIILDHDMHMATPSNLSSDFQAYLYPNLQPTMAMSSSANNSFKNCDTEDQDSCNNLSKTNFGPAGFNEPGVSPGSLSADSFVMSQSRQNAILSSPLGISHHQSGPARIPPSCISTVSLSPNPPSPTEHSSLQTATQSSLSSVSTPQGLESNAAPRIRPTKYVMEYQRVGESVPLSNSSASGTAALASPAHFRNEEFQPQIWKAEDEYSR